jgi:hypothetical protein
LPIPSGTAQQASQAVAAAVDEAGNPPDARRETGR